MKFPIAPLLALAGLHSVHAGRCPSPSDPKTCEKEAQLVNKEMVGQKYTDAIANTLQSDPIRVIHPDDVITLEYSASRLNIHLDDNDKILSANCA
ncbi:hypothetical protein CNMCM5793_000689 [Aspergillus hiratsukae]|uniref:Elastase inhibitor n=1 Tax=Aspergillus hiratsukae TaxID=1194566 RepID=A0A8H6PSU6_9EURO|nr:hypothetical protein CNMCM5793_000689 [Aspergillus hiratsukae]KAF7159441.1 hypothetical protein CNMCM6106_006714 [Aspergillus hiratsukae]